MSKKLWLTIFILISLALILVSGSITSLFTSTIQSELLAVETLQEHHSPPSVVVEPGSAVETASYIIFKDEEGIVYAKNGLTGEIDFSRTDASTVIQAAINALTNGGKIFVKAGTYECGSPIILKSNIAIVGEGMDVTTLKLGNGVNYPFVYNENAAGATGSWDTNITMEDLTLDGNGENQQTTTVWGQTNMVVTFYADHLENFVLRRVKFYNGRDYNLRLGFSYSNDNYVRDGLVDSCIIAKTTNSGGGNCDLLGRRVTYINCEAYDSARDGFDFNGQVVTAINLKSHNNAYNGFYVEGRPNTGMPCYSVHYIDCQAYNNTNSGFVIDTAHDILVLGGKFYLNYGHGISIKNAESTSPNTYNIRIEGADIFNNNQDAVATPTTNQFGIVIGSYVTDVGIIACSIFDDQTTVTQKRGIVISGTSTIKRINILNNIIGRHSTHGIQLYSPANATLVAGNVLKSCGTYGIEIGRGSTNNIIRSNYFTDNTYGIRINSGASNCVIELNDFRGQATSKIDNLETTTIIKRNLGFVTENSGTATIANNEWVAHGLAAIPTKVLITTRTATYGTPAVPVLVSWIDQNSTHFQVSAYWTNGTAIIDDAINIAWYAEV
jgi:parallel beta-helix repeat protein